MLLNLPFLRASTPLPYTYYPIGDIHGYPDALDRMFAKIHAHRQKRPAHDTKIILLGDLVNRGPDSKGVMDRVDEEKQACRENGIEFVLIQGNHDLGLKNLLLADIKPDEDLPFEIKLFFDKGGLNTLASYGVNVAAASPYIASHVHTVEGRGIRISPAEVVQAQLALLTRIPQAHLQLLEDMVPFYDTEKFYFCHAGIDPTRRLADQQEIVLTGRNDEVRRFAKYDLPLEKIIVHGHTPTSSLYKNKAQINLDNGIYKWGTLGAAVLTPDSIDFLRAPTSLPKYDKTLKQDPAPTRAA